MSGTSHPDSTGDPSPMADNVPTDRGAGGRRGSKFRRSGSSVQAVQETMKEKQARYKESREARKKLLTPGHKYIFEILADRLSLELQAVEDFVLDAPSLAPFDDFFAKGGSKTIAFVYQETEVPGIECGRTFPGTAKGAIIMRLFLANLSETCLTGLCPFFVRTKIDVPVNIKNIHEEIYFSMLDATEGLLKGTRNLLSKIMMPAVCATENWGALNQSKHGEKDKQNFKDTITRYIHFLDGMQACIEGTVQLKTASNIDFSRLVSFEDVKAAAADVDMVHQLEEALMMWYKQIEQVLTESDQMRKEADASGPLTELEHWKRMSAKFNSIIEHVKGPECKAVVNVLNINRSKTLKLWRELDARITDCANEAKDNVKFLYTLEKVCQPLYNCDPVTMAKSIQNLINAIRMIHSVSQYYNTSERMTSLFIKVTNQMVTACRAYITDNGTSGIWEQDTQDIIKKIQVIDDGIKNMDCIYLFREYQSCFHKTKKQTLERPGEKPFEVSEMYIFGKFEGFCKRLEKITRMITAVKTFSVLGQSTIEGIDTLASKFQNIYLTMKKKQYDILAPRKAEFEVDFAEFMNQLQMFMNSCFSKILSSQHALFFLQRFQKLNMPCLKTEISSTVGLILQHYVSELESVKKLYQIHREDPPLARNMPPIAGKVLWIRQLYRSIQEPIHYIEKNSEILSSPEGKEVVRMYNRTAAVFVEFELLYHRAWMREVSQLQYALQATLLVRHLDTGKLLVNFDPKIMEIVRETKCMLKMGLEVPDQALRLVKTEWSMKANKLRLETLLCNYEAICEKIPAVFYNLMASKIKNVESVLRHGLVLLNWSSLILDNFFQNVDTAMSELNHLLKKVRDICEMHIDTVLQDVSETNQSKEWAEMLDHKSRHVEEAVKELIEIFNTIYESKEVKKPVEVPVVKERKNVAFSEEVDTSVDDDHSDDKESDKEDDFEKECKEMYAWFSTKLLDALVKATRLSLDTLKRRIFVATLSARKGRFSQSQPSTEELVTFIKSEVHLTIPNVVMVPSLDDIQQAINRLVHLVLEVSRGVTRWGQEHHHKGKPKSGTEHKDICKLVVLLTSAVNSLRKPASDVLKQFHPFKVVWAEDRQIKVKEFMDSNPYLTQIKSEILHYVAFEQEIDEIKPSIILGSIELSTAPLKMSLTVEAKAWKKLLCKYLNEQYKKKMMEIMTFTGEHLKKLSRPIADLEDVRFAMEALSKIRDSEIKIDMTLGPIEEAYGILNRFEVEVTKEEAEGVDTLRYSFIKLQSKARSVQDQLVRVQPKFKRNLLESVTVFQKDVVMFTDQYELARFDDLWRKFITYSKELSLLQKLYGLYDTVMAKISGYYDILWTEVDIEAINAELLDFQNRYCTFAVKRIDDFSESCPLLEMMAIKAMKQRHWDRITGLTGKKFEVESDTFALQNIMEANLLKYKEDIEDICISAVKEKDIEAKLAQVVDVWSSQSLSFMTFKGRGELMLKGTETSEIVATMEDSLMLLGSLLSNRYNAPFKKDIQNWVFKLSTSSDIIEQWLIVQNLWVYLEAVFVGGDIAKQLPQEAKRFQNIDKSWIKIMQRAHEIPNVVQCCVGDETMGQLLPHLQEQLELCQKSLTGYLEKKRLQFPRFFFVSDPSLLEILGQASDPHTIQPHLLGVFDNVNEVEFHAKDYDKILAVISQEGEKVPAADLQINDSGFQLLTFLNQFQAQVGLLGIQMLWTRDSEEALRNAKDDKKIMPTTNQKFLDLLNTLISQTTHDLTKFDRIKFETLVTIHVHQRDIFDDLVKMHIKSTTDFEWLKQSRFYFKEDLDHVLVSITDVDFVYQNEFLGCTDRLALGMSMGGAPAGPAGTGKTETTKDMGRCLGKYVVVFNCSDQMDFRGLGRIYKAAQQIYIVLSSRKDRKTQFIFTDGDLVSLNPEFGLFITMNPGYAGRQELPENLKVQFRTVSMMVPDRQIIMRVKLASCGFIENVVLAQKFFVLYKLCEEQLTKQVHYDFGLRNILSVLRTLGANKRARPQDTESSIVMRVLRDMNLSKLVDEDEPLFLSLISDLFPGIQLDGSTYAELQVAVANQVELAGLVNHPSWNLKLVQLYESSRVRHGLMTLGPSGAGKTAVINILMRALSECGTPHREMRMNPKAITAPQMFGRLDAATNDWTDGIFSTLWRKTLKTKKGENIWIVLDGPVDAIWIENLNSVLDDNKTLTLANGDRIVMSPACKLVFEVHNMDNASPATVSRVGMVFMSSSALSWRPILQVQGLLCNNTNQSAPYYYTQCVDSGWAYKRSAVEADNIMSLYDKVFEDAYSVNLLEGLIPTKEAGGLVSSMQLERLFVFCLMWSVGALLELEDREKLEAFIRAHESKVDIPKTQPGETIFEYMVNQNGNWDHWNNYVVEYIYPTDYVPDYAAILVPNAVLLIGEQGTAKTVMIKGYTNKYDPETDLSKSLNFSSATEPTMFQRMGSTYGPPGGRRMTIFVDDINMPIITNEIVRQMMEMTGMYSLDKPGDFTTIVDMQMLAAMIHPGGGRNDIPQRLKRQFTVFNCTLPSNTSIDKIFGIMGCGYFHECREFKSEISEMVKYLVSAGRILWQWTKVKMLPTPSKFHYIFNLRDLSRIWQGMLIIKADECDDIPTLLALFKCECTRVIADRFVCFEDKVWFEKAISRVIQEHVDPSLVPDLHPDPYFVDFLREALEPTGDEADDVCLDAPKVYELFLREKLIIYQSQYNENVRGASLDLVFFTDAMTHLIKISRIIRTDCGNALLVGVGGSGKQSLTRLASFIAGYSIFQITLTRTYNISNLMDDLKVSNLFARDELDEITQNLIGVMKKELPRVPPTFDNLYDYFISRARKNLHVVLCFSPVGEKFRSRSLKFPGLISGCTMDWFTPWPSEALVAVSQYFLSDFHMICSLEVKAAVVQTMGIYHDKVSFTCESYFDRFRRRTHVTPKSYLSFINGYKTVYSENYNFINTLAKRMNVGLTKLLEASESVAQLSKDLVVKEKELALASIKADKVLAEVTVSAEAATIVKAEVQIVKDRALKIVEGIEKEKAFAEVKLKAAKPALAEAEAALNTIKAADVATVRKLAKPPHLIMRIMDCCVLLFQKKLDTITMDPERPCHKPSWGEALKLMSGSGFMASLQQFPKDSINEEMVELLQPYFQMEDYTFECAKKVCGNVAGLLSWTSAMATFFGINKEVLPLKGRLTIANSELASAQSQLDEKQAELDKVQAKFDAAMKEKQDLLDDAEMCRNKMVAASALIDGLSGEKVRWTEQSKQFKSQINRQRLFNVTIDHILLVGDVLQLTGFLSYCGPFNQNFRNMLLKDIWEAELRKRKIPFTDNLNIISMLVDPPTISEWNLQGLPGDDLSVQNGIIVTKATRFPLLIDPQTQGKAWIKKKEKANDLQLYITTKLPNPAYTPEVSAKTSIIDFTVTMKGLENQLLGRVILTEKYELEAERVKLMEDVTANKRKMKELEDNLLEKLHVAAETEVKINTASEEYRPAASRGSILYFLITEMSMVNVMYQTSLAQFLKIFDLSMAKSDKSPLTQKRIANIIEYLSFEVFRYTVRGLYENHKFIFTLLLALKIDLQKNNVKQNEFQILIKGGAALDLKACPSKPFRWILDLTWLNLVELSKLSQFMEIMNQVSRNEKGWKVWFDMDNPEDGVIPDGYNDSLDVFHKLLLIRSWCPDRTLSQARKYVGNSMGMRFAEPVILNLESTWEESDTRTPLICFLSMGSDPTNQIDALAKKLRLEFRAISMGQGQEIHARRLLQMSMTQGGWVLLQNCHLGLEFMDELLETVTTVETMHDSFRVWITTEPHDRFSITLLQSSIKFTNDPPQGVRAGLKRTFAGISQDQLEICNLPMWKPMLYNVAFLHTVVQERRKFGPLGWNIPYEFNSADFTASVQFVQNHLDECSPKKGVSWVTVRYMLGEVQYGGRVTDDYDKRLLNCFSRVWFNDKIFEPTFCFYTGYKVPVCKTVEQYMEYIATLPALDTPQVFGLHPNADITYQTNTSAEVLDTITNIQPKESGGGAGETRESIVYRLAEDMLEKLPPNYVKARLVKMGALNSMNIFLRQEVDRMQRIIGVVRTSLVDLKLAIDGTIIMSENLRDALDNMFDARIPNMWKKISWESSTLGFWFTELLERNTQFYSWVFEGRPKTFWMTGFFNPQGFLTAMRQEVTRAHKGWALDTVTLHNDVLKQSKEEITASPAEGVYVYGLYLDGAGWDRRNCRLIEATPKVLFCPLPVIHMFAINSTAPKDPKFYICPVYKKPRRTDLTYITGVVIRTVQSPDHWILRGVALLCDIK
ncbi:unnamed protein product [Coregonus sp. 'balchen']|nr:unnamed protein product [Coregonus sp. 'balchen']